MPTAQYRQERNTVLSLYHGRLLGLLDGTITSTHLPSRLAAQSFRSQVVTRYPWAAGKYHGQLLKRPTCSSQDEVLKDCSVARQCSHFPASGFYRRAHEPLMRSTWIKGAESLFSESRFLILRSL